VRRVAGVHILPVDGTEPIASAPPTFDDFFRAEYRRVVGLTLVLCGRRAIAEELAQDAFVQAYRRWDRISAYDDPGAWVRRVAVNLATSSLRRRTREVRALTRLAGRRTDAVSEPRVDGDFWPAVRALPRRQAQCVALRYLEDRSIDDIAAVLDINPTTVRVHLHAARTSLATTLGEELDEEQS
jgi:RNA polymerase sigma factor (sigma-70 family)